jgi:hypothetical protein
VGWLETEGRRELGYGLRKEIESKCVMLRWMDDLVLLVEEGLSQGARRWLKKRKGRKVYGEELLMMQTDGVEAFGFQWREDGKGNVKVWADEKWTNKLEKVHGFAPQSNLFPGMGFVRKGLQAGVLKGMLLRLLDCTNGSEEEVRLRLLRLVAGFRLVGHRERKVREVVQAVQREAMLKLDHLNVVWDWSQDQLVLFCEAYDLSAKRDELNVLEYNLCANIVTMGPG